MLAIKGHSVPFVKAYSPQAIFSRFGQYRRMREIMTPAEFEAMYIARVKALRVAANMTAQQMATALKIPFERYKKYESRTPLPHELIEQFALITRVSVEFVVTGRRVGSGPFPDVPGPHMLDEWRASLASPQEPKKGRPKKEN
jgi:transcriptional regulator with XRE-family HTH domain